MSLSAAWTNTAITAVEGAVLGALIGAWLQYRFQVLLKWRHLDIEAEHKERERARTEEKDRLEPSKNVIEYRDADGNDRVKINPLWVYQHRYGKGVGGVEMGELKVKSHEKYQQLYDTLLLIEGAKMDLLTEHQLEAFRTEKRWMVFRFQRPTHLTETLILVDTPYALPEERYLFEESGRPLVE